MHYEGIDYPDYLLSTKLNEVISKSIDEPTTEQFIGWLEAYWEACGPWVSKENLTEDGKQIQEAFKKLLGDTRLKFGPAVYYGK